MGSEGLKGLFFVVTLSRIFSPSEISRGFSLFLILRCTYISFQQFFKIRICTCRKIRGLSCVSRVLELKKSRRTLIQPHILEAIVHTF
jgi:hypothetical protein